MSTYVFQLRSGPEDPLHWLRSLVSKALALGNWQAKADAGSLLKGSLVLTELFRPDTFLNALRQQTARLSGYVHIKTRLRRF